MKKNYNLLRVFSNFFILFLLISSYSFSQISVPLNTRMFETNLFTDYPGYIKHLSQDNSNVFYSAIDYNRTLRIKRFGNNGLQVWKISITNAGSYEASLSKHQIAVDSNDNVFLFFSPDVVLGNTFTDKNGNNEELNITSNDRVLFKFDKNGNVIWKKKIDFIDFKIGGASIYSDNNGDIYIVGSKQKSTNTSTDYLFIKKIEGVSGNTLYEKEYSGVSTFSSSALIDSQNNLYVFIDSYTSSSKYNFDGIEINVSFGGDNIMLKYDSSGKIVFGKNFYQNDGSMKYSIFSDGVFDGENIIMLGYLVGLNTGEYLGIDGTVIPRKYLSVRRQGLLSKIDLSGNVVWQKPLYSNNNLDKGLWTNISVDSEKNIYGYFYFKDKLNINNVEYQYDVNNGNKVLSKFNTNGDVVYLNPVDTYRDAYTNSVSSTMIDVIKNDVYNCTGVTPQNKFLNYQFYNIYTPKNYIATFGNLDSKYLSPQKNYLSLSNLSISNNPNNDNTFSFDLINNVNWTVESDQSWLNLGFQKLSQRTNSSTLINGTGDSKITMTAETNNTGLSRTANVLVTGDSGVSSSTIIVTQTGTLGTQESKTFVITLYPNPTSEVLSIQSQEKISRAEIYDFTGKLVLQSPVIGKIINVNSLSKGTYFIKLHTEKGIVNSKFIKN